MILKVATKHWNQGKLLINGLRIKINGVEYIGGSFTTAAYTPETNSVKIIIVLKFEWGE